MILREFLYLNDKLVTTYLEQLEGGVYEEEQQKTERAKDGSVVGELGFRGAKAQAGRKGASRDELQRTVKQPPPPGSRGFASSSETRSRISRCSMTRSGQASSYGRSWMFKRR